MYRKKMQNFGQKMGPSRINTKMLPFGCPVMIETKNLDHFPQIRALGARFRFQADSSIFKDLVRLGWGGGLGGAFLYVG